MKTLDEVIKALEICTSDHGGCAGCPYDEECDGIKKWDDILHYLKGYRDHIKLDEIRDRCMADNDPLTWDDLRQMEGTPVWVELLKGSWKGWDVVGGFDKDDFGDAMVTVRGDDYYRKDLGKTWQAYRKERE